MQSCNKLSCYILMYFDIGNLTVVSRQKVYDLAVPVRKKRARNECNYDRMGSKSALETTIEITFGPTR